MWTRVPEVVWNADNPDQNDEPLPQSSDVKPSHASVVNTPKHHSKREKERAPDRTQAAEKSPVIEKQVGCPPRRTANEEEHQDGLTPLLPFLRLV